jgi:hypothetical protein
MHNEHALAVPGMRNRSGGFERGGWARPLFDSEAMTFVDQTYQRADASSGRTVLERNRGGGVESGQRRS